MQPGFARRAGERNFRVRDRARATWRRQTRESGPPPLQSLLLSVDAAENMVPLNGVARAPGLLAGLPILHRQLVVVATDSCPTLHAGLPRRQWAHSRCLLPSSVPVSVRCGGLPPTAHGHTATAFPPKARCGPVRQVASRSRSGCLVSCVWPGHARSMTGCQAGGAESPSSVRMYGHGVVGNNTCLEARFIQVRSLHLKIKMPVDRRSETINLGHEGQRREGPQFPVRPGTLVSPAVGDSFGSTTTTNLATAWEPGKGPKGPHVPRFSNPEGRQEPELKLDREGTSCAPLWLEMKKPSAPRGRSVNWFGSVCMNGPQPQLVVS
ncbi:hypothetical protein VFPFJ_03426 [Purpureocillium lilacinum]|nr:hypothetical protein VFPFJ_03426 [Purpureocillium lilacinum]OAQ91686.1 hypothetical protein VFPFJ_03426 [Purpureocillium lilacinum]